MNNDLVHVYLYIYIHTFQLRVNTNFYFQNSSEIYKKNYLMNDRFKNYSKKTQHL